MTTGQKVGRQEAGCVEPPGGGRDGDALPPSLVFKHPGAKCQDAHGECGVKVRGTGHSAGGGLKVASGGRRRGRER